MKGKVALVMGGGAGTGRATALAFAREGASVVVADINEDGAAESLRQLEAAGAEAIAVIANMGIAADCERVVAATEARFGGLHAVSNNAALGTRTRPVTEFSEDEWDRCHAVTLKGVWLAMKYQLPLIEKSGGGAIVNIASLSGVRGEVYQACYSAAKGGVLALTNTVAAEYAKRGIRVNAISPGGINTGGMDFYLDKDPAMKEKVLNVHAMGRMAEPEEIADAVVYLCSDRASFITGHNLVVDGGISVRSNILEL